MERLTKTINNVTDYMEKDNRGVQITCYSLALFGLTVAIRKVRPFSKFRKPSDIPNLFIKERRELDGCVKRIDPNGGLLIIDHKQLIPLPFSSTGELPVKISGVRVSNLGTNWLSSIVAGQNVTFIPVSKDKNFVQCQVMLQQTTRDEKQQVKQRIINVGENLVKVGFATPEKIKRPLSEDSIFLRYYSALLKAERHALRKKMGYKYYIISTRKLFSSTYNKFVKLTNNFSKVIHKAPKVYSS